MNSKIGQSLVSMVIPSFNHARYIQCCINSVIAQDYGNIELIIIDDGSVDDSIRAIQELIPACVARFSRFEFRNRENRGLSATVGEALEWARGDYFAMLASDDILFPAKTSTLLQHMRNAPSVAGVFGGCELIDAESRLIGKVRPKGADYRFDDLLLKKRDPVVTPSQLLRRELLKEAGGYPSNVYIEDWYMWLRLTGIGYRLRIVPDIVVQYRQHDGNMSKTALKMYESRKFILAQFRDRPGVNVAMSKVSVMAAIDFSTASKPVAWAFLVESVKCAPVVIFSPLFVRAVGRVIAPKFMLRLLRSARAFFNRRALQ